MEKLNEKYIKTKSFNFPFSNYYFSLFISLDIYDKFSEIMNQVFIVAKLTNHDISWMEFPQHLYVGFSKENNIKQLIFVHYDDMSLKGVFIDWHSGKENPIDTLSDFLKQLLESEK